MIEPMQTVAGRQDCTSLLPSFLPNYIKMGVLFMRFPLYRKKESKATSNILLIYFITTAVMAHSA